MTGFGALSGLGENFATHLSQVRAGATAFRPLGGLLGESSPWRDLRASWIGRRSLLTHRKWSPVSMAALHVAREAVQAAGWTAEELHDAVIFLGTSRGPVAGSVDPWPERRALPLMAASNSMHSEPAAAVSIEFGIHGPWQVFASGCAAGVDALGMASLWLASGQAERALVIGVDLPLSPALLSAYAATGILSTTGVNDPFGPYAAGILPAEAAAAITLETAPKTAAHPIFSGYLANADAAHPIGMAPGARALVDLLLRARQRFGLPSLVCPHASGTASHSTAEPAALRAALGELPLCLLKPFTGHGIGGGGLLETALLAGFLKERSMPAPLPGLSCPEGFSMTSGALSPGAIAFKIASALGGKNALVSLQAP